MKATGEKTSFLKCIWNSKRQVGWIMTTGNDHESNDGKLR